MEYTTPCNLQLTTSDRSSHNDDDEIAVSYSVPLQHNYNLVVLWYELSNPSTKTMIIPGSFV